jgi:hypothetical protein
MNKRLYVDKNKFNLMLERMNREYTYNESVEKFNKILLTEGFSKQVISVLKGLQFKSPNLSLFIKSIDGDLSSLRKLLDDVMDNSGAKMKNFTDEVMSEIKIRLQQSGRVLTKFEEQGLELLFKSLRSVDNARNGRAINTVTGFIEEFPTNTSLSTIQNTLEEFYEDMPDLFNEGLPPGSKLVGDVDSKKIKNLIGQNIKYLDNSYIEPLLKQVQTTKWRKWTPKKVLKLSDEYDGYLIYKKDNPNDLFFLERSDYDPELSSKLKEDPNNVVIDTNKSIAEQGKNGENFMNNIHSGNITDGSVVYTSKWKQWLLGKKGWQKILKYWGIGAGSVLVVKIIDCLIASGTEKTVEDKTIGTEKTITYDFGDCMGWSVEDPEFMIDDPRPIGVSWWDVLLGPLAVVSYPVRQLLSVVSIDFSKFMKGIQRETKNTVYEVMEMSLEGLSIVKILNAECEGDEQEILNKLIGESGVEELGNTLNTLLGMVGVDANLSSDEVEKYIQQLANTQEEINELRGELEKQRKRVHIEVEGLPEGSEFRVEGVSIKEEVIKSCFVVKTKVIAEKITHLKNKQKQEQLTGNYDCDLYVNTIDLYSESGYENATTPTGVDKCEKNKKRLGELFKFYENYTKAAGTEWSSPGVEFIQCSDENLSNLKGNMETCETINKKKEENKIEIDVTIDPVEVEDIPKEDYTWQQYVDESDKENLCIVTDRYLSQNRTLFDSVQNGEIDQGDYEIYEVNGKKRIKYKFTDYTITTMAKTYWCKKGYGIINDSGKSESDCVNDLISNLKSSGCWDSFYG